MKPSTTWENNNSYKARAHSTIFTFTVRVLKDGVPGAWNQPEDFMAFANDHIKYVQSVTYTGVEPKVDVHHPDGLNSNNELPAKPTIAVDAQAVLNIVRKIDISADDVTPEVFAESFDRLREVFTSDQILSGKFNL